MCRPTLLTRNNGHAQLLFRVCEPGCCSLIVLLIDSIALVDQDLAFLPVHVRTVLMTHSHTHRYLHNGTHVLLSPNPGESPQKWVPKIGKMVYNWGNYYGRYNYIEIAYLLTYNVHLGGECR